MLGVEKDGFKGSPVWSKDWAAAGGALVCCESFSPRSELLALLSSRDVALEPGAPVALDNSSSGASATVGCILAIIDWVRERVRERECDLPNDGDSGPLDLLKKLEADGGIDVWARSASVLVGEFLSRAGSGCLSYW